MASTNTRTITIKFAGSTKGLTAAAAEAGIALKTVSSAASKQSSGLKDFSNALSEMSDKVSAMAAFARPVAAFTSALSAVNVIVPAIIAMSGALGLLPGAIGVAAGAMLVLKLGSAGITAAFKGVATTAEKSVSATFQKSLAPAAKNVSAVLAAITPNANEVAKAMSGVVVSVTGMARSADGVSLLRSIMDSTRTTVANLGAAMAPLIHALLEIISVGAQAFAGLTAGVGGFAQSFDAKITAAAQNGSLRAWIDNGIAKVEELSRKAISAFQQIFAALKPFTTVRVTIFQTFGPALLAIVQAIGNFVAAHPTLGNWIVGVAIGLNVLAPAIKLVSAAFSLLSGGPIGLIIAAIALLVAGFIYLWNTSSGFRNFWIGAWKDLQAVVSVVVAWFQAYVWPILQTIFAALLTAVRTIVSWFQVTFLPTWRTVWTAVTGAFQAFIVAFQALWNSGLGAFIQVALAVLGTVIKVGWDLIVGIFTVAWDIVKTVVTVAWDLIVGIITGAFNIIKGIFEVIGGILTGNWSLVWHGIQDIVGGAWDVIRGIISALGAAFSGLGHVIGDVFSTIGHVIGDIVGGVISTLKAVIGVINDVVDAVSRLLGASASASSAGNAINRASGSVAQNRARASGGPVSAGRTYLVGERGPELLVPQRAGTVIPASQTAGILGSAGGFGGDLHLTLDLGAGITQRIKISNKELVASVRAGRR